MVYISKSDENGEQQEEVDVLTVYMKDSDFKITIDEDDGSTRLSIVDREYNDLFVF